MFWQFIRQNFICDGDDDWRIFVTSDVEAVELEAIREFGVDRVIRTPGVSSHFDRETNLGDDCTRVEKPVLDFHFLQMCDKAVISRSGFGRLGTWNRLEPLKDVFVFDGKKFETAYDELGEKQPPYVQLQQQQSEQKKRLLENTVNKSSNEVRIQLWGLVNGSNLTFVVMLFIATVKVAKYVKTKRVWEAITLSIVFLLLVFNMTLFI